MTDPDRSETDLARSIDGVRRRVATACRRVGRSPDSVTLVAVTKSFPVEVAQAAAALGIEDFGENHANELARKSVVVPARWHFIGKVQTGTAPRVADHAAVIHSGEPGHAISRVSDRAVRRGARIRTLVQVDFTGRRQGVAPDELDEAARELSRLEGIELAGLMTLPPQTPDLETTRTFFKRLRELRDRLRADRPDMVELSMGMSGDYEVAVEEGATMVRVGTALFGVRPLGHPARGVEG